MFNRIVLIKHEMNSLTLRHWSIFFPYCMSSCLCIPQNTLKLREGYIFFFFLKKETSKPFYSLSFWHPLICHVIVFRQFWAVGGNTL